MNFARHWSHVGVEPDVPEAGDVMVVDVGRTSVAIARDDDGAIHAFHTSAAIIPNRRCHLSPKASSTRPDGS